MDRRTFLALPAAGCLSAAVRPPELTIRGEDFLLNGKPTYSGRTWNSFKIEGLLLNIRAVQGIFDDQNPATRDRWAYPDTHMWDPQRNTREFVAAMEEWRRYGVLSFTINLQGGSPEGYSTTSQLWDNSAYDAEGNLKPDYMSRLEMILERASQLGMAPVVGCYYFGQDQRLKDEAAVRRGVVNTAQWLLGRGYRNVMLEIANECDVPQYHHDVLKPARIHELIELAKAQTKGSWRLLCGTSFAGGSVPTANVVQASDFLLLHGNGAEDPARIARMILRSRRVRTWLPMPVLINEDDHFHFDSPRNHMIAALGLHCSWGYFDPGKNDYKDGYQCPPVNWGINTDQKEAFFARVKEVTGS